MAEFKDRGSKFIAYAFPVQSVEEFKQRLNEIKKEHPKATHHCFAYRIGPDSYRDGNNFRVSDDGEPSGSAGRPILGQIDSKQLTDTLVVVVRYFGGSLLGIPGLINAYKSATALCLQLTPVVTKSIEVMFQVQFPYTQLDSVLRLLRQLRVSVVKKDVQLFCTLTIAIPVKDIDTVQDQLQIMEGITITKMP